MLCSFQLIETADLLLQQLAVATRYLLVEVDLHELPETTAVVVANSFGVPKSFQQRVGCRVGQGKKRRVTKTKTFSRTPAGLQLQIFYGSFSLE